MINKSSADLHLARCRSISIPLVNYDRRSDVGGHRSDLDTWTVKEGLHLFCHSYDLYLELAAAL
jgi:hypothetical protein